MASNPIRIGVACPNPGERAAFLEWLSLAGYEPVPMLTIDMSGRELTARPIEALIADVSLVSKAELPRLVRTLGANRPLILVGNPEWRHRRSAARCDVDGTPGDARSIPVVGGVGDWPKAGRRADRRASSCRD